MKNNMMFKKMLKATLFLVLSLMMMPADAKVRGGSEAAAKSSTGRRVVQRSRGGRRPTQGRYVTKVSPQRPVQQPVEQIVPAETPSRPTSGGGESVPAPREQQPVSTGVDTNKAIWVAIKKILLRKKESPSEALAIVKKIRAKRLTDEQEEWLDMFEGWMVLAMLQKTGQLSGTDSTAKIGQQGTLLEQSAAPVSGSIDAQKWEQIQNFLNEKVKAGLSSQALEYVKYIKEKYIQEKPFMFTSEQQKWLNDFEQNVKRSEAAPQQVSPVANEPKKTFLGFPISNAPAPKPAVTEIDPVTGLPKSRPISVEPSVPTQPQRQGALQKAWAERPTVYQLMGGIDPHLTSKPAPQGPVKQPQRQGALQKAWAEAPSPSNMLYYVATGGMGQPLLSGSTAQAPVTSSQPGNSITEQEWEILQNDLKGLTEQPSQALIDAVERIKETKNLNNEQRKWLEEFQQHIKMLLREQSQISVPTVISQPKENTPPAVPSVVY